MLDACLESAARLDPAPEEVVIAVDGTDPGVMETAGRHGLRTIPLAAAPGVSAARNAGVAATGAEIIAFADSDVLLPADFAVRALEEFHASPGIAAIIGSYDNAPAAGGIISRYRNLLHHFTHQQADIEARTFWAGCGAIRRQAFEAVDGFDESFARPSVEDIDLGYRLRRNGHRIRMIPGWQVKHLKKWRFLDLVVTDVFHRAVPWTRLLRREGRIDNDLNTDRLSRASAGLVCAAVATGIAGASRPPALVAAAFCLLLATILNWPFYRFLSANGGWSFAAACIPLHWLYFLGGAIGFALGFLTRGSSTARSCNAS